MSSADLTHLELLTQIDDVVGRLSAWAHRPSPWEPLQQSRSLLNRLLERVDPVRMRIDAPLVVATFGGTGVGKSSLTNALVGDEVTQVGRQRPTTLQPTLIAHTDTNLDDFGLPLDDLRVLRRDSAMLRDWLLVDCPDPDTTETETTESNLARLHRILPCCDVLLYVSTQQKYRSARVSTELAQAAEGCKLIFVQTHADQDDDIRADWRSQLEPAYQVAEMFFVDSRAALAEQQQGLRPTGEVGRLLDLLLKELSAAQRVRIRRGNLFGLLYAALERMLSDLDRHTPAVQSMMAAIDKQRDALTQRLADRLRDELLVSRGAWERRLMAEVSQLWGLSPFALVLRAYHSQAGLLASWTLMRARSTAQFALWGAVHGARWISSRQEDSSGQQQLARAALSQISDSDLR
ncbi:MAG TPA: GTPase, partial [Planctomycetaceae bacterium]|nr:GTPase [Planctomycetaceae bacterium]